MNIISPDLTAPKKPSLNGLILCCAVILTIVIGALGYMQTGFLYDSDDILYQHSTGARIGRNYQASLLEDQVHKRMKDLKDNSELSWPFPWDHLEYRWTVRKNYSNNYILPSLIYRITTRFIKSALAIDVKQHYPEFLSAAMTASGIASYTFCFFLTLILVVFIREQRIILGFMLSLSFIAFIASLEPGYGSKNIFRILHEGLGEFFVNLWLQFLNPSFAFSPFGFYAKSQFVLLIMPFFLLRWQGKYSISYALLVFLSFIHQSFAGLTFLLVFANDLLLRPSIFRKKTIFPSIITIAALFIFRDSLFLNIFQNMLLWVSIFFIFLILAFIIPNSRRTLVFYWLAFSDPFKKIQNKIGSANTDFVIILLLWTLSLPFVFLVDQNVPYLQSRYFWSQVHGRLLAIFLRPMIFLILGIFLTDILTKIIKFDQVKTGILLLFLSLFFCLNSAAYISNKFKNPIPILQNELSSYEADFKTNFPMKKKWPSEAHIYYVINKSLDNDKNFITGLIGTGK